uniref:Serpentine receptor class gamma n=1 Tax=Haemonchus contortus TaxID=6289 RepID=A0A912MSN5_HAECO
MATSQKLEFTEQFCIEHGVTIVTSTYYRISLLIALVISLISGSLMIHFLYHRNAKPLLFHPNWRMLFFSLCLCCLSFDITNIVMKVHHLALSLLYTTPCQVFLSKGFYMATNILIIFSLVASLFMQISILVERWTAVISIQNYEFGYRRLGPFLIAAAVSFSLENSVQFRDKTRILPMESNNIAQ